MKQREYLVNLFHFSDRFRLITKISSPILDLLPRNLEFHNLSHVTLTSTRSRTLGLGLKFRPTLIPPAVLVFDNQIQDFCRNV